MSLEKLQEELKSEQYARLSNSEVVELLNTKNILRYRPLSSAELLAWCAANSRYVRLEDAANNTELSSEIRSIIKVSLKLMDRDSTSLNLSLSDRKTLLGVLVASKIFATEEADELYQLASYNISRAEELDIPVPVLLGHIEQARMK